MSTWRVLVGDCCESMRTLPAESVQCCVTSPPYWGLRDYGHVGQLGLEQTPEQYVAAMVDVFREVRRVLRPDGVVFLNIGDSYAGSWGARGRGDGTNAARPDLEAKHGTDAPARHGFPSLGVKPKDLVGIPWRLAFALQADGWYLRSDIIWHKPNPMPESVTDRPTKAHEYLFLLSKSERYYYDLEAIAEDATHAGRVVKATGDEAKNATMGRFGQTRTGFTGNDTLVGDTRNARNARTVWTIATQPYSGAHFATFPPELAERCIKAGSKPGDTVLDPFAGSGTTGMVATGHGRDAILCELNPEYVHLIRERCGPMLEDAVAEKDADVHPPYGGRRHPLGARDVNLFSEGK